MIQEIPADLEAFIQQEVSSGKFRSREEVITEALRQLQERERKQDALRQDIQQGIDQLDQGQGIPAGEIFSALREQVKPQDQP